MEWNLLESSKILTCQLLIRGIAAKKSAESFTFRELQSYPKLT